MVPKLYDLAAADEDQRSYAIEPVGLPVNSAALTKLSGHIDLSFRFFLGSKAMIAAHAKAPSARRQVQHP
jgi:hypothetical protein